MRKFNKNGAEVWLRKALMLLFVLLMAPSSYAQTVNLVKEESQDDDELAPKVTYFFLEGVISEQKKENKKVEKVPPQYGLEVERDLSFICIEEASYNDVKINIESSLPVAGPLSNVRIKVYNSKGKKLYKKTLYNSCLYVFKDGQIQVGRPLFNQALIMKSKRTGTWMGEISEKKGFYE